MVERRASSCACFPWGTGNLLRKGFGMIVEVGGSWFSELFSCPYRAVLERGDDEILLLKGRRDKSGVSWSGSGHVLVTLKCLGCRCWWAMRCLVVGEGSPSSPSLTVCSAGKKPWWNPHRSSASLSCVVSQPEAECCEGATAYLTIDQLWLFPEFNTILCFQNYVFFPLVLGRITTFYVSN